MPRVVIVIIVIAITVYALVEAFGASSARVRLMPKWLWIAAIVCLPGLGAIGWLLLGRPTGRSPGSGDHRPIAPDDDPDFLRRL